MFSRVTVTAFQRPSPLAEVWRLCRALNFHFRSWYLKKQGASPVSGGRFNRLDGQPENLRLFEKPTQKKGWFFSNEKKTSTSMSNSISVLLMAEIPNNHLGDGAKKNLGKSWDGWIFGDVKKPPPCCCMDKTTSWFGKGRIIQLIWAPDEWESLQVLLDAGEHPKSPRGWCWTRNAAATKSRRVGQTGARFRRGVSEGPLLFFHSFLLLRWWPSRDRTWFP